MNIETFRDYCLAKEAVTEGFPFDDKALVFKVAGKMFAITNTEGDFSIALKCDPEKAIALREEYSFVKPGFHLNKKHWNTIEIDDSVHDSLLEEWITHSYDLVIAKMPKKLRAEFGL